MIHPGASYVFLLGLQILNHFELYRHLFMHVFHLNSNGHWLSSFLSLFLEITIRVYEYFQFMCVVVTVFSSITITIYNLATSYLRFIDSTLYILSPPIFSADFFVSKCSVREKAKAWRLFRLLIIRNSFFYYYFFFWNWAVNSQMSLCDATHKNFFFFFFFTPRIGPKQLPIIT